MAGGGVKKKYPTNHRLCTFLETSQWCVHLHLPFTLLECSLCREAVPKRAHCLEASLQAPASRGYGQRGVDTTKKKERASGGCIGCKKETGCTGERDYISRKERNCM